MSELGYDAVKQRKDEDDLDRWRFASEIVDVVTSTSSDWSARIGIFGKWGEGKSTVLGFAEQMLRQNDNVVFTFNPWAAQNLAELWEEFGTRFVEALSAAKIPFEGAWKTSTKAAGKSLGSKGVGQLAETAAAVFGKDKVYNGALNLLSRWLRYDGDQIRKIRQELGNRRLVVLIDDLDRCRPELLPQLLLSLRELLDLPGFTFLLAFDDEIVARALVDENPSWGDGVNFLEKILDFRFHLPAINAVQKERFVARAMARYCPFVPAEKSKEVQDLLPNNPRKLKALVRSLAALQPQIARHDEDELNWTDIWLAQMLRLESYAFFECLLMDDALDREVGGLYRLLKESNRSKFANEDEKDRPLKSLIAKVGVKDPVTFQRLIQLVEAARARASMRFRYACELAVRPHIITWREFRAFKSSWLADRQASTLSEWLKQQAAKQLVSSESVDEEAFTTILARRHECLAEAAECGTIEAHEKSALEAEALLEMIKQFLFDLGKLNPPRFKKLYGQVGYWIGFRKNTNDLKLREREEASLVKLALSVDDATALELLEIVDASNWDVDFGDGVIELRKAFGGRLTEIIAPAAAREAVNFIIREDGVRNLSEAGRFSAAKACLFRSSSPIWTSEVRPKLLVVIQGWKEDSAINANVRDLFDLLIRGLENGVDSVNRSDIATFLRDHDLVKSLWEAVTSKTIQYRLQITYIRGRQQLIQNGIPEELLPLSEELRLRLLDDESKKEASGDRG
jgi:KAP family P-loop domain